MIGYISTDGLFSKSPVNMPGGPPREWMPVELTSNEKALVNMGYNLEELERDNPYNSWMYEDES
jgi:hypothetical protein